MTTEEIYSLAKELTDKDINNILKSWDESKEEANVNTFKTLVRLGDSRGLAMATAIAEKYKKQSQDNHIYELAYLS